MIWLYTGVKFNELNLMVRTQNQINIFMTVCLILVIMISVWSVLSLYNPTPAYVRCNQPLNAHPFQYSTRFALNLRNAVEGARIRGFLIQ